jgi:hypothetical protein
MWSGARDCPGTRAAAKAGVPGFEALAGSCLRGPGHADASALTIVRRPTRYVFSIARPDLPGAGIPADRGVEPGLRRGTGRLLHHEAYPASCLKQDRVAGTHQQHLDPGLPDDHERDLVRGPDRVRLAVPAQRLPEGAARKVAASVRRAYSPDTCAASCGVPEVCLACELRRWPGRSDKAS